MLKKKRRCLGINFERLEVQNSKIGNMTLKEIFPNIARGNHMNIAKATVLLYVIYFSLFSCFCIILASKLNYINTSFPLIGIFVSLVGLLITYRFTNSLFFISNLFLAILAYFFCKGSLASGGIYSVDNFFLFVIPLGAYVLSEVRSAVIWLFLVNAWAIYLFYLADSPEQIQLFRDQTTGFLPAYYLGFCITASITAFGLLSIFYFENRRLIKKLETNQAVLQFKNTAYEEQAKKLVATQERLKNSNRELKQYAYVASHDLKQPIKTINGFANLLKKDLEKKEVLDEENTKFLGLIISSSNNMLRLVNDLLAYAKLTSVQEVPFQKQPLDEVLNNVLINLQNQIDNNEVNIERTKLPTLDIVPVKINQVFQNIISNAIKFKKKAEPLTIKIHSNEKGQHCEFTIEDNGIGIEKSNQEKIFAPFKKLHKASEYAGSGIGLATCKRIIELHKGKIWVESEKDKGTKFIFTLPYSQSN